jgi:hypothetical protein
MPFLGNIANIVQKKDWYDLGKLLKQMQQEIEALRTARSLENSFIGRGGVTIGDDGALTVQDSDGHTVCIIGALPDEYNRADGSRQPGFAVYREDGSLAAILADVNAAAPPYKQAWQVYDRAGNVVLADDTNGGLGLANPNLVFSNFVDSNYATWPKTNASGFTTIAYCWHYTQNPQVQWTVDYTGDVGVGGQFRMMVSRNGGSAPSQQVGPTKTQPTDGSFGFWNYYGSYPFTLTSADICSYMYFELQARVTSGTGNMYGVCSEFGGGQS